MTYDNIKSHKKPGFYPLFKTHIFQKTTGSVRLSSCSRVKFKAHNITPYVVSYQKYKHFDSDKIRLK